MAIVAYLRDGRIYADEEAYHEDLDHGPYTVVCQDPPYITATLNGTEYTSLWCWPLDAKKPWGIVPLVEASTVSVRR